MHLLEVEVGKENFEEAQVEIRHIEEAQVEDVGVLVEIEVEKEVEAGAEAQESARVFQFLLIQMLMALLINSTFLLHLGYPMVKNKKFLGSMITHPNNRGHHQISLHNLSQAMVHLLVASLLELSQEWHQCVHLAHHL